MSLVHNQLQMQGFLSKDILYVVVNLHLSDTVLRCYVYLCNELLLHLKCFVGFFDVLNLHFGSDDRNKNISNINHKS